MLLCNSLAPCIVGFILDFILGDPIHWYHPVMAVGWLIKKTETALRKILPKTKHGEKLGGLLLFLIVSALSTGISILIIYIMYKINTVAGFVSETIICYFLLATKSLKTESMKVYDALNENNITEARRAVSMIVGRDTKYLDEIGIRKAAVETIAENTSDGSLAPLFYMILFGPAFGVFYKSVNTMDSMVGYKNEKYRYFGSCAARADDLLNLIPARISAFCMLLAAFFMRLPVKRAWRVYLRDRYQHKSPNSAHTEAVMAGAMGISLAGDAWYFGKKHHKPTIGDDIREITNEDIKTANQMLYITAMIGIILFTVMKSAMIFPW